MLHRPRVGCQRDLKETLALDKVELRGQTPASPGSPASIPEGPLHTQQHVALALSQESQRDAPWKDFPDVASNHGNTSADPVATVETGGRTASALPALRRPFPPSPQPHGGPGMGGGERSRVPCERSPACRQQCGTEDALGRAEEHFGPGQ